VSRRTDPILVLAPPACRRHDMGAGHPECPERLDAVRRGIDEVARERTVEIVESVRPATGAELRRVHSSAHVDHVHEVAPARGHVQLDPDTAMGPDSLDAALAAAGAGVTAVDRVLGGDVRAAFCAVRPPGHHAERARAMGFCLFDNVAVAAAHALEAHGLERVAIADFDVHHGNGTEDIFANDARVLFCSSFQDRLYPYPDLRGAPNVVKVPIPAGSSPEVFREAVARDFLPRIAAFRPQLLLVSAGFDAHASDMLANLRLRAEDFGWITGELRRIAETSCSGRIVSLLEGGYALDALPSCVAAHLREL
jgi:acetoin utilization deacetylase AcuC-like enzyme